MLMHMNRTNCAWAAAQSFQPPDLWGEHEVQQWWLAGAASDKYRKGMLAALRTGQVAAMFNAFEDYVELPNGQQVNLWCADVWTLVGACRPGLVRPAAARRTGSAWPPRPCWP